MSAASQTQVPAIEAHDIHKSFRRVRLKGGYSSLKTILLNPFAGHRGDGPSVAKVLKGLDFQAKPGEMVGLIGRNGSGKSTFLKILSGIYKPNSGRVTMRGRVSALIELGAGFHPEFSGRENIFLNGTILGLSREEIRQSFDKIVEFAELEEFIDAPVRTYSSGMYVRLGFSVAVNVNPEILLIDEVMAVGDVGFKRKCEAKIREFKQAGKTILLVSHDLDEVERFCDRAVWLNDGTLVEDGDPARVINEYRNFINSQGADLAIAGSERWGQGPVSISRVEIVDKDYQERHVFRSGEGIIIRTHYTFSEPQPDVAFGVGIFNAAGHHVYGSNTHIEGIKLDGLKESGVVEFRMDRADLVSGLYYIDVATHSRAGQPYDFWTRAAQITVQSELDDSGIYCPPHSWELK